MEGRREQRKREGKKNTKPERGGEVEQRKPGTEIELAKERVSHIQRGGGIYLFFFITFSVSHFYASKPASRERM